jgi:hypothetical protein
MRPAAARGRAAPGPAACARARGGERRGPEPRRSAGRWCGAPPPSGARPRPLKGARLRRPRGFLGWSAKPLALNSCCPGPLPKP